MGYSLRDSVIKNPNGKIKFKHLGSGGGSHYHIGVWLFTSNEEERDAVDWVEYELHPTFRNRTRQSTNRNNDFSITFWAWGAFNIEATVHFADGITPPMKLNHRLNIRLPRDTGDNYELVE